MKTTIEISHFAIVIVSLVRDEIWVIQFYHSLVFKELLGPAHVITLLFDGLLFIQNWLWWAEGQKSAKKRLKCADMCAAP